MGDLRCASVLANGMAKTLEWRNGLGGVCRGGATTRRWGGAVPAKSLNDPSAASCSVRLDESVSHSAADRR